MKRDLIVFSGLTISILLLTLSSSQDYTCENPLSIDCNTWIDDLITNVGSYDFYNYTLPWSAEYSYLDVCIHVQIEDWVAYNVTGIWDPGVCYSDNNSTDSAAGEWWPGAFVCKPKLLAEGNTYFVLVGSEGGFGILNYTLNLTCGNWCGNGIVEPEKGEECEFDENCTFFEECYKCECNDVRLQASGCNVYDYCLDGMNPDNVSAYEKGEIPFDEIEPCCVNSTGDPEPCCIDEYGNSILNCSTVNYRRNPSVNASSTYCYVEGYDITDLCIDCTAVSHALRINCTGGI